MPCPVELLCPGALGAVRFGVERAEGRALLQCPHASIHAPQLSAGQHLETICTLHLFEFQDFWCWLSLVGSHDVAIFHIIVNIVVIILWFHLCHSTLRMTTQLGLAGRSLTLPVVSWQTLGCLPGMSSCLVGSLLSWLAFAERSLEPCLAKPMLPSCDPWKTGHATEILNNEIRFKLSFCD